MSNVFYTYYRKIEVKIKKSEPSLFLVRIRFFNYLINRKPELNMLQIISTRHKESVIIMQVSSFCTFLQPSK